MSAAEFTAAPSIIGDEAHVEAFRLNGVWEVMVDGREVDADAAAAELRARPEWEDPARLVTTGAGMVGLWLSHSSVKLGVKAEIVDCGADDAPARPASVRPAKRRKPAPEAAPEVTPETKASPESPSRPRKRVRPIVLTRENGRIVATVSGDPVEPGEVLNSCLEHGFEFEPNDDALLQEWLNSYILDDGGARVVPPTDEAPSVADPPKKTKKARRPKGDGAASAAPPPREPEREAEAPPPPPPPAARPGDAVTVLRSLNGAGVNKRLSLNADGELVKEGAPRTGAFMAQQVPIPDVAALGELLRQVGSAPDLVVSCGLFNDAPSDRPFAVLSRAEMAAKLHLPVADEKVTGWHEVEIGGKLQLATCRLKDNTYLGNVLMLDRDLVGGMPPALAALDFAGWLAAMTRLLPPLVGAGYCWVPSTTARILIDGQPVSSKPSGHLYVMVEDAAELPRVWPQLLIKGHDVRLTEDGPALSFMRPKFKRDGSGQIVAEQPWSIYDPSTCSPERLIFDGQPEVAAKDAAQITLLPPAVDVVPGRRADLKLFQDLSQAEQAAALQHGVRLERTRTPGGHKPGTGGPRVIVPFLVVSNLRLDQELELADGTVKTVGQLWVEEAPKTRCQAHLRESVSLAAYYHVHLSGVPFVFDAGVSTKYQLHPEDVVGPPVEAFEAHVVSWAAAQRPGVAETEIERQVNRIGKACGRHETSSLLIHTLAERLVKALRHLFDQTVMPDKELLKHLERQLNREARQAAKQQQSAPTTGRIDNYDLLERMNRSHAVIAIGGSTRIVQIDAYDPDMKQTYYRVMQKGDFELRHCNELVQVGPQDYAPLGAWWLGHSYRRQHLQGLALDPSRTLGPEYLNMWKDWGVQPCDGDPSVFLEHVEFLASDPGNGSEMHRYIIGWLATKVQHPERPAETALVLRGDHGAGKGALARLVQAIFGAHARLIAKGEHFIGKFNSHLEDCCLLICDEAVWAGDPRQLESLKSLITEPTMMYEKKFVDAREGVNHLGVIMMSNRNFVVRVERGDRRFVMVDVASDRIRDKPYWKRYSEALADPVQVGAFLKFLLEYDLSGFDIRAIPSSVARTDQKLETQGHEERWLQEVLHRGRFSSTAYTVNSYGRTCEINPVWEEWVVAERLRDDYKLYMQSINQARFTKDPRTFGKFLANYFPRRRTKHGWGYDLGPLEAAREAFQTYQQLDFMTWTG